MLQRALFSLLLAACVGCMDELQIGDAHDAGLSAEGGAPVDNLLDQYSEEIAGAWALADVKSELVMMFEPDPDPARPRSGTFKVGCKGCAPDAGLQMLPVLPGLPDFAELNGGSYNLFAIENGLAYFAVYPKPLIGEPASPLSGLLSYDPRRERIAWSVTEWTRAPP